MRAVHEAAERAGVPVNLIKVKTQTDAAEPLAESGDISLTDSGSAASCVTRGCVIGGTAWVFSRDDMVNQLDYLVVDEAGQFSLANVVATGQAAKNIILVADQMQLAQPTQGSHPGESGRSALEYLLQGKATVPPEVGVLLDVTWRMHPHIRRFISDAVYDSRLARIRRRRVRRSGASPPMQRG
jgi:superfamily I DNA and/or RNA helicase